MGERSLVGGLVMMSCGRSVVRFVVVERGQGVGGGGGWRGWVISRVLWICSKISFPEHYPKKLPKIG